MPIITRYEHPDWIAETSTLFQTTNNEVFGDDTTAMDSYLTTQFAAITVTGKTELQELCQNLLYYVSWLHERIDRLEGS